MLFYKLRHLMRSHVTLTLLLKIKIGTRIHSFIFLNEKQSQDISPSSTAADYYASFTHVSQYL